MSGKGNTISCKDINTDLDLKIYMDIPVLTFLDL